MTRLVTESKTKVKNVPSNCEVSAFVVRPTLYRSALRKTIH